MTSSMTNSGVGIDPTPERIGSAVLSLEGIVKRYGHVEALRSANFDLRAGEVHALLGDNGAGKSTLLKIAAGAVQPDEGRIILEGREVSLASPMEARNLGIETVYQDLALAGDRSGAANLFIAREIKRKGLLGAVGLLDRPEMARRARAAFDDLSVTIKRVDVPVRALSGGQKQGVALARAALWARSVLLLDEPTAALGVRQRAAVEKMIDRLREKGFGIVLVSHDVPEVLRIADRITVMRQGRDVAQLPAAEASIDWVVTSMVAGGAE